MYYLIIRIRITSASKLTSHLFSCSAGDCLQSYHPFILQILLFFSTMSQLHTHSDSKEVIVIRHAQSNFNKGFLSFKQLNGPHLSWYQCIEIDEFNKKVSYAKDYIDCAITSEGVQQCKKAKTVLREEEIDVVLVSPHLRALQTCRQIFGQREVRVEVHPILAEVFRYSCDISNHIDEKIKEFPDYDFSFMKDHSELWFVDNLSEHLKNTCNSHIQASGELSFREKQEKLLELMQSKVVYESPQELRMRTWKIKDLLAEYKKKYKKIAIVSHFQLLEALTAKQYNEIGEVANFQWLQNARPYFLSLADLLSVR